MGRVQPITRLMDKRSKPSKQKKLPYFRQISRDMKNMIETGYDDESIRAKLGVGYMVIKEMRRRIRESH